MRITKIDLPQQVQDSVFDRMRATFKAQAAKLRAEGVGGCGAHPRRGEQGSRRKFWPTRRARPAQIRGQGDASASEVYAKSYSKNAEFYSFYRSMQSYREAVGTQGDMLVIAPDNAYFKYFNKSAAAAAAALNAMMDIGWTELARYLGRRLRLVLGARRNTALRQSGRRAAADGEARDRPSPRNCAGAD